MSDQAALEAFLGKWRARWPEWRVAEVFVPVQTRAATLAWLALRQELADAAWAGADPRPGAAKLAWWSDELRGWVNGRRRHPLGLALQRIAAPWNDVAEALPALEAARELPMTVGEGTARWQATVAPFALAAARVSATIDGMAGNDGDSAAIEASLGAVRALAGEGSAEAEAARARLRAPSSRHAGARADRIFAAIARLRLQALAAGGTGRAPAGHWRVLWAAWRAGRSVPPA